MELQHLRQGFPCTFSSSSYVSTMGRTISSEEEKNDLELERQLKILNKTPIKTFQIAEGQIVDCVDMYKQPAFDHPLLKNHKIQLRPSDITSSPHESSSNEKSQSVLQKVDCPKGTVPIRRTSKEDLIRAKSFAESFRVAGAANTSAYHQNVVGSFDQHIAVVSTSVTGKKHYGIFGTLNAQNPTVGTGQSSSSQIWIESHPSAPYNTLQAGWIVSPELFKDFGTHFFGYWKGSSGDGCYNMLCLGFIQRDESHHMGELLTQTSYYGDPRTLALEVSIYQDDKTGNWWLTEMRRNLQIGYWPKELVPSLSEGTPIVSWGGAVKVNSKGQGPEMGNGHFPAGKGNWSYGRFIANMKVFNEERYWEEPIDSLLEIHADKEQCYKVEHYEYFDRWYEKALEFGGPGGIC